MEPKISQIKLYHHIDEANDDIRDNGWTFLQAVGTGERVYYLLGHPTNHGPTKEARRAQGADRTNGVADATQRVRG